MMRLLQYLQSQSPSRLLALNFLFVLICGLIDYITGEELSFSIFYLLPISIITWLLGRFSGIVLATLSAGLWLVADLSAGQVYSSPVIPFWNMIVRYGFFLIIVYILSALKTSLQWRDEFGAFIVHDLRSPLSNVMSGLALIQEETEAQADSAQKLVITTCLSSCQRMLILINSLLDLDRLEKGLIPLQYDEVDVRELVQTSINQVRLWAEHHNICLTSRIEEEIRTVYADPTVTTGILVNLLGNALKFSSPNTTVTVRVVPAEDNMVAFSVTDQGVGVPEEWVDKVFNKFVRVEAGKVRTAGTGLGLAFCRLAVEKQGGRIWMNSSLNQGTTVTFTLHAQSRTKA